MSGSMKLTRRGKVVVALTVIGGILAVPLLGGYFYLRSIGFYGSSDPGKEVTFEIPKGATVSEIGEILEENGIISSAFGFRLVAYVEDGEEDILAGNYTLPTGLNARDALNALVGSSPAGDEFVTVTFPEGSWLTEFADAVSEDTHVSGKKFLQLATSGKVRSEFLPDDVETLEGLLFPSTYQVIERDTPRSILQRLVDEFEKQVAGLDFSKAEDVGLTPYEAIIVASMIEAETRVDKERPMVARVIYNRIEIGWTLGIDATVLYALGDRHAELTASALDIDSPFNTRKFHGLPPTPIGAPGLASIEAALNPAEGDWRYYVLADCEGNHAFSVGDADFLEDKAAYQQLDCG